jgi:hypothetical protein
VAALNERRATKTSDVHAPASSAVYCAGKKENTQTHTKSVRTQNAKYVEHAHTSAQNPKIMHEQRAEIEGPREKRAEIERPREKRAAIEGEHEEGEEGKEKKNRKNQRARKRKMKKKEGKQNQSQSPQRANSSGSTRNAPQKPRRGCEILARPGRRAAGHRRGTMTRREGERRHTPKHTQTSMRTTKNCREKIQ